MACANATLLALEHGLVARGAFGLGAPHAATALIRLQFEAAVRAAWWLFAADDGSIALLDERFDGDAEAQAKRWPTATSMLRLLEHRAPAGLVMPLRDLHAVAWGGLNSFVHTGLHPMQRRSTGFPEVLAEQLLRASNALTHLTYRLRASLTGSPVVMDQVTRLWRTHAMCLPLAS